MLDPKICLDYSFSFEQRQFSRFLKLNYKVITMIRVALSSLKSREFEKPQSSYLVPDLGRRMSNERSHSYLRAALGCRCALGPSLLECQKLYLRKIIITIQVTIYQKLFFFMELTRQSIKEDEIMCF